MDLTLNPSHTVHSIKVADTDEQVYIIDDFLLNPQAVTDFAHQHAYFNPVGMDGTFYPGKREQMPAPYVRVLEQLLNQTGYPFTAGQGPQRVTKSMLSLVTLKAAELTEVQKMPHIDSSNSHAFASVH